VGRRLAGNRAALDTPGVKIRGGMAAEADLLFPPGREERGTRARRTQWGVMNETGSYPGQPWLWLCQLWYELPSFRTSANVDLIAIYLTVAATLLLLLVPFVPGLRVPLRDRQTQAATVRRSLASHPPSHPQYEKLRTELKHDVHRSIHEPAEVPDHRCPERDSGPLPAGSMPAHGKSMRSPERRQAPTGAARPVRGRDDAALAVIKATHTLAWFSIESCMAYVLYAGAAGRTDRRAALAGAVVAGESLVFAANGFRCPLTQLAENLGAADGSVTDIWLPRWFARNLPAIHIPLLAAAAYLNGRNLCQRQLHP